VPEFFEKDLAQLLAGQRLGLLGTHYSYLETDRSQKLGGMHR
jgi:hypothetical protein